MSSTNLSTCRRRRRHQQHPKRQRLIGHQQQRSDNRINADLQQQLAACHHALTHELPAPLRAIHNLTTLLDEQLAAADATPQQRQLYQALRSRSEQLDQLLADLRHYLAPLPLNSWYPAVNSGALLTEIVTCCQFAQRYPHHRLVVQSMPTLPLPQEAVRELLHQLLDNAFKFSQQAAAPRVVVRGWQQQRHFYCLIQDNGIGFDPQHQSQLGIPFRRLVAQHPFPGSGIGLARCQRLLQALNGELEASVNATYGTYFRFKLPL